MTTTFTFVVYCQTEVEDHCGGGPRLDKFMTAAKLREFQNPKIVSGFGDSKLKLLEFNVYASKNRGLGDLGGTRYGRPVFVGLAEGEFAEADLTKADSEAMKEFTEFLKAIFSTEIFNDAGEPELYRDFSTPPDPNNPRDFSWVVFLVHNATAYKENFIKLVGPGHGD